MQALKRQNQKIERLIENYLQQIEKQKEINTHHQNEIQTLLKFNQRLLNIIQTEIENKKDRMSLKAITEKSERESDLSGPLQSFIQIRRLGPNNERVFNSLIDGGLLGTKKLSSLGKQIIRSQLNHSSIDDNHSQYQHHLEYPSLSSSKELVFVQNDVKNQLATQIQQLQKFKKQSTIFYDNKISQIKNLSGKINQYSAINQLQQINQRLNISPRTANLLKRVINKC